MPVFSNWQLDTIAITRAEQWVRGGHIGSPLVYFQNFLSGQLRYFLCLWTQVQGESLQMWLGLIIHSTEGSLINPSDSKFRLKNESEAGITFPSGPFLNPYPDLEQNWVILTEFQHNSQFVRSQSHTHTHWLKLRD